MADALFEPFPHGVVSYDLTFERYLPMVRKLALQEAFAATDLVARFSLLIDRARGGVHLDDGRRLTVVDRDDPRAAAAEVEGRGPWLRLYDGGTEVWACVDDGRLEVSAFSPTRLAWPRRITYLPRSELEGAEALVTAALPDLADAASRSDAERVHDRFAQDPDLDAGMRLALVTDQLLDDAPGSFALQLTWDRARHEHARVVREYFLRSAAREQLRAIAARVGAAVLQLDEGLTAYREGGWLVLQNRLASVTYEVDLAALEEGRLVAHVDREDHPREDIEIGPARLVLKDPWALHDLAFDLAWLDEPEG